MDKGRTDIFHNHLNICQQCRNNPFDLCPVGAKLLGQAVFEPDTIVTHIETPARAATRKEVRKQRNRLNNILHYTGIKNRKV